MLHERAGEGIEALFGGQLEDRLDELARHYSHSSNISKAVKYLHLAGQQAARANRVRTRISIESPRGPETEGLDGGAK